MSVRRDAEANRSSWGPHDERGALNLIGPAQVKRAGSLIRTGEVLSLAQPLGPATAVPAHRHGVLRFMNRDGGDYAAGARQPGGFQFAEDTVVLPTHAGTHIDALGHVWHDDLLYNGFRGSSTRSTTGVAHCGADKLTPIVTRGVLIDVATGEPSAGQAIGRDQLAAALGDAELEPGDVVLLRTGWLGRTGADPGTYFSGEPGIDLGAAIWLAEAGVAAIGADNFAVEQLPFPEGQVFPVHQYLLRDRGVPLIEGLVLDGLAERGASAFLFVALPLHLVGSTASPISPVAIL